MGLLFSRFRKCNTKDQLESIEKDIKNIHEYRVHTQQRQKQFLGSLIAFSVVIYVCFATVFYFYYFPSELSQQVVYSLPLVLFPLLVWILRELMKWFFQARLRKNEVRLTDLLRKKRKILEDVMETETYKVARELLEKYDPDQFRKPGESSDDVLSAVSEPVGVRQRPGIARTFPAGRSSPNLKSQMSMPAGRSSGSAGFSQGMPSMGSLQHGMPSLRPPGPPMPRPILPRERTFMERLIEYLVGDGPNTRFALICRQCNSHNGMALKEEFEYIAFRCCYCYHWNPARKQRPAAPRLPDHQFSPPSLSVERSEQQSKSDLPELVEEGESDNLSDNEDVEVMPLITNDETTGEQEGLLDVEMEHESSEYMDEEFVENMQSETEPSNSAESMKLTSEDDVGRHLGVSDELLIQEKEEQPLSEIGEGDQPQIRLAELE